MRKKRIKHYVRSNGTHVRSHLRRVPIRMRKQEEPTLFYVIDNGVTAWMGAHQLETAQAEAGRDIRVVANNFTMPHAKAGIRLDKNTREIFVGDIESIPAPERVKYMAQLAEERARYSPVSKYYDPSMHETISRASQAESEQIHSYFKHKNH